MSLSSEQFKKIGAGVAGVALVASGGAAANSSSVRSAIDTVRYHASARPPGAQDLNVGKPGVTQLNKQGWIDSGRPTRLSGESGFIAGNSNGSWDAQGQWHDMFPEMKEGRR